MKPRTAYKLPASVVRRMAGREFKLIQKAWAVWRPPLAMSISGWADEFRRMPSGVTSEPGRYSSTRLPWCKFILDTIGERTYRDHILVGAAQVMGKTEILNSVVGYYIHADPSPILVKYPTRDSAEAWSKAKLDPMINATPVLRAIFGEDKARDGTNTITEKKYPGGSITMIGANSPSGMRQRSKKVVIQDEIDADERSAGVEGDPCTLADKRAESYADRVLVKASTPTIAGHSRSWKLLENSTFHEWHAKCPHCGGHHVLAMAGLQWPKDKDGAGKESHNFADAFYVCPLCDEKWDDLDRQRAIMAGEPRARNPKSPVFGFHVGGLYKLIGGGGAFASMLHEFAENFVSAKRSGPESMKVWTNTFLAECWEEEFEKLDEKALVARAEDYDPDATIPEQVLRITAGADVQEDRIECEFIGWGEGEETWGLGYHVLHGDTQGDKVWEELDLLIAKTFKHPSGLTLGASTTFIDSGHKQDRVLQFTGPRRSRGIFASKGINTVGKQIPIMQRKPSINNKRKVQQWMVGITAAKTVLYSRIMLPVPGAGSMHFPKGHGYDARYFHQLTSEKRMTRYSHGRPYYIYEAGNRRNEPLDIRVYALAAHRRVNFDSVAIKAEMAKAVPVTVEPVAVVKESLTAEPERIVGNIVVERTPIEKPAGLLPAYVPMSQRIKSGGSGDSMFKR